jgi:elongation factor Ts
MTQITAKDVQALRQATGAGMMDAKRALTDADGDFDRATDLLREWGLAKAAKRGEREQTEGAIGSYLHVQSGRPVIGVLVELAAETDFVAKSDDFQRAANDLAMHVAAARPSWVRREEVPEDVLEKERELLAAQARNENKPDHIIEKIVEGRINSFYQDHVLLDQRFVKTEQFDGTVGEMVQQLAVAMGENISVARIARLQVGENASDE